LWVVLPLSARRSIGFGLALPAPMAQLANRVKAAAVAQVETPRVTVAGGGCGGCGGNGGTAGRRLHCTLGGEFSGGARSLHPDHGGCWQRWQRSGGATSS
jgi:hypothetical protein